MSKRTKDQVLDEAVHAAACVAHHYGGGFSAIGLAKLRELLSELPWGTDSSFLVDVYPGDKYEDFHERIIWPAGWDKVEGP